MIKYYILIITILIFHISCNNSVNIKTKNLLPIFTIDELNDSTFISNASDLFISNGFIFVTDKKNSRIIEIDTLYNVINIFGNYGKGPGELISPSYIQQFNDSLFIYDEYKNIILVYTIDGNYLRDIKLKYPIFGNFCISENSHIYYYYTYSNSPFLEVDSNGNIINTFGKNNNDDDSFVYLFNLDSNIVTLNMTYPKICYYNKVDYHQEAEYDLKKEKFFQSRLLFKEKELLKNPNKSRDIFNFIKNAIVINKRLYFSYLDHNNDILYCNKIVVFDLEKKSNVLHLELKYNNEISLEYITGFNIANNNLYVFDYGTLKWLNYKL